MEVVITGKLSKQRKDIIAEFAPYNVTVSNSVKRSTNYLITDDPYSGSQKNTAADLYKIPKISEEYFRKMLMLPNNKLSKPWTINNKPVTTSKIVKALKPTTPQQKIIKKQKQIKPENLKRHLVF